MESLVLLLVLSVLFLSIYVIMLNRRLDSLTLLVQNMAFKTLKEDIKSKGGIEVKFEKQSDGRNLIKSIKRVEKKEKEEK